jgi:outer membrane receptor for ferrienterochelin and colicins
MKYFVICIMLICGAFSYTVAQHGEIRGHIKDASGGPLSGANVLLQNTTLGAASDEEGYFEIKNVPHGSYTITAKMLGYEPADKKITVKSSQVEISFTLKETDLKMDQVVVTGTKIAKYLKDTPVRTEVITSREIELRNPTNFIEAVSNMTGVDQQIECSICNVSSISLQGLPGRYTQVLIDGMPQFSSLGQMYSFMQYPVNFIEQVEVVKGGKSSLYGTDAIGGIINVRTKKPGPLPQLYLSTQTAEYGENRINGFGSFQKDNVGLFLTGEYFHNDAYDGNDDGITEITENSRSFFSGRMDWQIAENTSMDINVSAINEKRQGGALGSDGSFIEVIDIDSLRSFSESILTRRTDVSIVLSHQLAKTIDLYYKGNMTKHFQDSDYEGFLYVADQEMLYHEIEADVTLSKQYILTAGGAYRTEDLHENAAISEYHYKIGSGFGQINYTPSKTLDVVVGGRYDHHNIFGDIVTSSANLSFEPAPSWVFRFNFGQGFRAPTTFYELDHGTGAKYKYNIHYLANDAERSNSFSVSADYFYGAHNLSVQGFYHEIKNFITAYNDESTQSFIVDNIDDLSSISGIELGYTGTFFNSLSIELGHIHLFHNIDAQYLGFARPNDKFKWALDYDMKQYGIDINIDGSITGKMNLREVYGEALNKDGSLKLEKSPVFAVVNGEISKEFSGIFKFSFGAKNIFDYKQVDKETPLMYDGEGNLGDVVYIWGPLMGRKLYAQISLSLK